MKSKNTSAIENFIFVLLLEITSLILVTTIMKAFRRFELFDVLILMLLLFAGFNSLITILMIIKRIQRFFSTYVVRRKRLHSI
ncbi:MAG: hypothetical protein Q7R95_03565 [bacterium]|nr:hypothetical protein [bacterium]